MPARNRYSCRSRGTIWLLGLFIQWKRGGLAIRRMFHDAPKRLAWLLIALCRFLCWLAGVPRLVLRWTWTSLFWPAEDTEPACPRLANLEQRTETRFESPTRWEQLQKLAGHSGCMLRKTARISKIQFQRAGLRGRMLFQKRSAWTFATVAGSLGVLLMIVLQLMYSFQTLGAKESPETASVADEQPKTRIDPGFPQVRELERDSGQVAPTDPFAPAQSEPLDQAPPWEPLKPLPEKPLEPPPFVDPLDQLPPFDAAMVEPQPAVKSSADPFAQSPPLPMETPPPGETKATGNPFRAAVPVAPTNNEPIPFVDPLDNLPPFSEPAEQEPPKNPMPEFPAAAPLETAPRNENENPFVDPLDNLPPFPQEPEIAPEPAKVETTLPSQGTVELGVGMLRLPADDDERFVLESEAAFRREQLSREVRLDNWDRSIEQDRPAQLPYWDRLTLEEKQRLEQDLLQTASRTDYDPGPEAAQAELSVGIQKRFPPRSNAYEPLKYEIVVENRGRDMIDSIDVDEAVPPSHQLTDAAPAGYFENNLLRWRLREFRPGEKRRLSVEVVPLETGTIETITSIRPSTRVSSLTEVEEQKTATSRTQVYSTPLRLRRSGYRTVSLDESVLFTNHVQNLTQATQRDVEIVEQVPAGFRVIRVEADGIHDPQSGTITWKLAAIAPGATVKLDVNLQAESTGELVSRVKGRSADGEAVPIRARVLVNRIETNRISAPTPPGNPPGRCSACDCECCCPECRCR